MIVTLRTEHLTACIEHDHLKTSQRPLCGPISDLARGGWYAMPIVDLVVNKGRYRPRRSLIRRSSIRNSASMMKPTMPIAIMPLITIDVLMLDCPLTSR